VAPRPRGGGNPPKIDKVGEAWLKDTLKEESDLSLAELCNRLREKFGVVASDSSMQRTLARIGLRRKKTLHACEKETERVENLLLNYIVDVLQYRTQDLISIDETGTKKGMFRSHGRAEGGKRCHSSKLTKKGINVSLVGNFIGGSCGFHDDNRPNRH
jgi:hypothetical protein